MKAITNPLSTTELHKRLEECHISAVSLYHLDSDIIVAIPKESLKSVSGQEFLRRLRTPRVFFKSNKPQPVSLNNQKKFVRDLYTHGSKTFGFSFRCKSDRYKHSFGVRVAKQRLLDKCEGK